MEESTKTDQILEVYKRAAVRHRNIGITLQAHLLRSEQDLQDLLHYPGRIRLVKGAYQEPEELALPRSKQLDERYVQLVDEIVRAGHPISIASHDAGIIKLIRNCGYRKSANIEFEMLYGIQGELLKSLKNDGYQAKVYLTYGTEWYLRPYAVDPRYCLLLWGANQPNSRVGGHKSRMSVANRLATMSRWMVSGCSTVVERA